MRRTNKKVRKHRNNNSVKRLRSKKSQSKLTNSKSAMWIFKTTFAKSFGESFGTNLGKTVNTVIKLTTISILVFIQNAFSNISTKLKAIIETIKLLISSFLYTYFLMKGRNNDNPQKSSFL